MAGVRLRTLLSSQPWLELLALNLPVYMDQWKASCQKLLIQAERVKLAPVIQAVPQLGIIKL